MTDFVRKRGDTYADEIAVFSKTTGAAIDITGYSFVLTVDPSQTPTTADDNLYAINGSITKATGGLVEFAPSAIQADQQPGAYFYDIQMTDDAGRIRTIQAGRYTYEQDISK